MKATFHGVRGSVPAPGVHMNRYGGNTSCIEICDADELIILDAGTGLIGLGRQLMKGPFGKGRGSAVLLLSHLHWDHIQGFPFFQPLFVAGNRFTIVGPAASVSVLESLLEGQMSPHFSPLQTMRNLGATIELLAVETEAREGQPFSIGNFVVRALSNPHGTTVALGYRLEKSNLALVYIPDIGYLSSDVVQKVIGFCHRADLLIHDCTFSPEDKQLHADRGLSSIVEAVEIAAKSHVKRLAMFHYDQDYTDEYLDALTDRTTLLLAKQTTEAVQLIASQEGMTIDLAIS